MLAKVTSCTVRGIDGMLVEVEVDISNGLPCFTVVGLPDEAVKEARERVRAAVKNAGFEFPMKRITVNLAPADVRKEGPGLDLPIALGVLAASGQIAENLPEWVVVGELSLDGRVKPAQGILPMALAVRETGGEALVVPRDNGEEAALVTGLTVYGIESLAELIALIRGELTFTPVRVAADALLNTSPIGEDFADVIGQGHVKRALEIAAAGGHNVLMIGPPGSGKTMLARRLPGILPPLSFAEALEVTKIYSVAGLLPAGKALITARPFRSPHHTVSDAGLVGGGRIPRPGEVSLAHHGILFLDELPEFARHVLEALRQPLEDGVVTVARVNASVTYPARILLLCSMNPCPCGFFGDPARECLCTPPQIQRYQQKISGPLLDRIDLHVPVPRLEYKQLEHPGNGEPSAAVRKRVIAARERQRRRLLPYGLFTNAAMETKHIREFCALPPGARRLLREAFYRLGLSMRAHDRILKVARTIADLAGEDNIAAEHVAEAIQYRTLDRKFWE